MGGAKMSQMSPLYPKDVNAVSLAALGGVRSHCIVNNVPARGANNKEPDDMTTNDNTTNNDATNNENSRAERVRLKAITIRMTAEQKQTLRVMAAVKNVDLNAAVLWAVQQQAEAMRINDVLDTSSGGRGDLSVVA